MGTPSWSVKVDWDHNGAFGGTGEDVTTRTLQVSTFRGVDVDADQFQPVASTASILIGNESGDYYPANTGSPITGLVKVGRAAQIRCTHAAVTYDLFQGRITDISINPHPGDKTVELAANAGLGELKGVTVSVGLQTDIDTGAALALILDEVGWPTGTGAGQRSIQTGKSILPLWWLDGVDAFTAAVDLLRAEGPGARLDMDETGRIIFRNRHHRLVTSASTTIQETFRSETTEPTFMAEGFEYQPSWETIVNDVTIPVTVRSKQPVSVVWTSTETYPIAASATRTVFAELTDPSTDAVSLVENTDYIVTAGSISSTTVTAVGATTYKLELTAGGSGATVADLQLRAAPYLVVASEKVVASDATSQSNYGVRSLGSPPQWLTPNQAQDWADEIVSRYADPPLKLKIAVRSDGSTAGQDTRAAAILGMDLDDRIRLIDTESSLDDEFFAESIRHTAHPGGLGVDAVISLVEITGQSELGTFLRLDSSSQGRLNTNTLAF